MPELDSRSADIAAELRLAIAVRDRDRKATAEFVEGYVDAIYSYVSHRLFPQASDVDDVVQEVFLAALQSIASYTGAAPLQTWLLGIARHKIDDYYRKALRDAKLEDIDAEELGYDAGVVELVDRLDMRDKTMQTLARLREDHRMLLQWRYWDMKTAVEMAALTGRTEKAIERALARARAQFRTVWEGRDV